MAELVKWSEGLSVGIQEIDEQHKVLVALLNELNQAIHEKKGTAIGIQITRSSGGIYPHPFRC